MASLGGVEGVSSDRNVVAPWLGNAVPDAPNADALLDAVGPWGPTRAAARPPRHAAPRRALGTATGIVVGFSLGMLMWPIIGGVAWAILF